LCLFHPVLFFINQGFSHSDPPLYVAFALPVFIIKKNLSENYKISVKIDGYGFSNAPLTDFQFLFYGNNLFSEIKFFHQNYDSPLEKHLPFLYDKNIKTVFQAVKTAYLCMEVLYRSFNYNSERKRKSHFGILYAVCGRIGRILGEKTARSSFMT
ncbi:MAG: hypothetical protein V8Q32_05445, partial [Anaerotignum faecicola]